MFNSLARKELLLYRTKLILLVLFAVLQAGSIIGQAWFFARLIDETFLAGKGITEVTGIITWLLVSIGVRMIAMYCQEKTAGSLAAASKKHLRDMILDKLFALGAGLRERHGDVVHLLTDGLENVESYIARYVPQMMYAILVPLMMAFAIIDSEPWVSIILLITFPLIPFFMILIGKKAEQMNARQWERMSLLSGHFLDVLQGLVTLKLFGRAVEQREVIAKLSAEFRDSTLRVLRVAFLSALVLELIGTISTALVAVYMGVALLYGEVEFLPAFFVLLLAPEFYAPLRQLGAAFHTGMAGHVSLERIEEFMALTSDEPANGSIVLSQPIRRIALENVGYRYDQRQENALCGISAELLPDKVTMLVGQSGAGKSTIAQLVMRMLTPKEGRIIINDTDLMDIERNHWRESIVYVPQKPHLFKGTVRENICFGRETDEEAMRAAARAAEADEFIEALPNGYDTVLAEGGLGLSGGQRQRIALARAFLKSAPILILDEITAHLDVGTEQSLARALRRLMKGKIVLLIGHRLETMRWADTLLVMRHGRIEEQGSFNELLANKGYFYELVKAGIGETAMRDLLRRPEANITHALNIAAGLHSEEAGYVKNKKSCEGILTSERVHKVQVESEPTQPEVLTTSSALSVSAALRLLFTVLGPAKHSLWLSMALWFLTVFMNVGLLTTSSWLITTAALHPELAALSIAIVGVRFFGISRAVCRYLERYVSHHMAFQGLYGLRVWLYERIEPLAPAIFSRWGSGDLLGRIMADIETLQFFYLRVLIPPVGALLLTIIGVIFLQQFSYKAVVILVVAFILTAIVLPLFVYRHNRRAVDAALTKRGEAKETVVDVLSGMMDILLYRQETQFSQRIKKDFAALQSEQEIIHRGNNVGDSVFTGIAQITMVAGALVMIPLYGASPVTGIYIAVVAIALQSYFEATSPMMAAFHHGKESYAAVRRLQALAMEPTMAVADPTESDDKRTKDDETESILVDRISFAYDAKSIYQSLSLRVRKGEHVAIVGPSGSGKTTLFSLLERFYEYSGRILIHGQDIRCMKPDDARREISALTQDTYLFHATLEDNIRLAKPSADEAEIAAAIDKAELTDWVASLPKGLKTMIGSGGANVSGGERQRIALARLYLRNTSIWLLDEPLEGLDQLVRNRLQQSLQEGMQGKTVLYITHDLNGLETMDRIIFMEDGRITEEGTYADLMKQRGAFYRYRRLSMEQV